MMSSGVSSCDTPDCGLGSFPALDGKPVLIDFERSIVDREALLAQGWGLTSSRISRGVRGG